MNMKKNFEPNNLVQIYGVGMNFLEGKIGKVVGVSTIGVVDVYIVDIGKNPEWKWTHATFPETCLKRITE